MLLFKRGQAALICLTILVILSVAYAGRAVETGPVERKWGLGWANGLTAPALVRRRLGTGAFRGSQRLPRQG